MKKLTEKEVAEHKARFRDVLENCKPENLNSLRISCTEAWIDRILDELTENQPQKENDFFATAEETREAFLSGEIKLTPAPLQIDEVAHAYFNTCRVENWEILGEEFAGHKIGAIYSFVLGLVEKYIGESMCIKSEQFANREGA